MREPRLVAAAVVALAVAGSAAGPLPAQAAAVGQHHISGNVFAADGGGLPEVYVDLYRDDGSGNFVFYTPVDDDPDPHFSQLVPDGRYKVEISTADPESFQDEWYDDQESKAAATVVTLDGADVVLGDIFIEDQPTITGKVVDEEGEPITGIRVFALDAVTFNSAWPVWTGGDGTFESQVSPGDWTVYFDDDGTDTYASEYLGDANSRETATVVSTQDGATDVGTVVMSEGGSVSGTVTGPDGLPMRDYHVTATAHSTEPVDDWTDRDGHYELPRLTPGDYQVRFDDDAGNFVTQFNGGAADQASANPVTVIDHGNTPGVDASLTAIPHPAPPDVDVTGRVTDSSGRGVPGAHVFAFAGSIQGTWDQEIYDDVLTDATGHYYLTHLDGRDVSTFKIEAGSYPGDWDDDDYLLAAQWYAGATGATATPDAVPVAVGPGAPATADITLPDAGLLHGRTYTTGGTGYPGNADGDVLADDQHGHWVDTAFIYSDVWRFYGGMAPGTYHLDPDGIGCPGGSLSIDVVVKSLRDTNVPGAAFCRPRATVAPSILGSPAVGEVLTVDPGQGSAGSVVTGYEWLVDETVADTGTSYTLSSQDAGHQVAVRVTRRTDFACCSHVEGTATSAPVTVPVVAVPPPSAPPPAQTTTAVASSVSVTPRVRRHQPRVTLRIAVTTAGVAAAGEITLREGARSLASSPLVNGLLVLTVRGAQPGRHTYTVSYSGTDGVSPSSATVTVRVRRPHPS